jgi:hypothetical protein
MAPIRWFVHRGPQFGWTLLGGCLALILTAAPAMAELSSVDAYGGQAQVLGKPVHRHAAAKHSTGAQSAGRESGQSAGTSGSQAGGGSAGSASGAGSHADVGSRSGAPATPDGSSSAAGTNGGNAASAGSGRGAGSHGHGHGSPAGAAGTGGSAGASGAGQSPPIAAANAADVSDGSLSLSALDVLLLVVVCLGLAGVGVLIRRWSRQTE